MKSKIILVTIGILLIFAMVLSACAKSTSTTSSTKTITSTSTSVSTTQANWWDKFGTPQYGGEMKYSVANIMAENWDVYSMVGAEKDLYYEALFEPSWTLDRKEWSMTGMYYPDEVLVGHLAETWEITDLQTITVHLRQGVRWHNKAPANGREFVASDVQAHYDRIMGTGGGYTEPSPMYAGMLASFEKVTATDKYTVVFKFKSPSAQHLQTISDRMAINEIECPDWVALGGKTVTNAAGTPLADWKTTIGTGAWMFTDFVSQSSYTWSRNPDYWGTDPRFPKNKTPYADTLVMLVIADSSTRLAALRTGKIIYMDALTAQQATDLKASNPELQQIDTVGGASGIGLRVDMKPFTDIRVRKALDMSLDRAAIAKGFYSGASTGKPVGFISSSYVGYAFAYDDWPQSLKDEYAYNPTGAKQLLSDAGYPNGFDTNVVTTTDTVGLQLIQVMKAYFDDIDVNMEIRSMENTAEQAFTRSGKHDQMSGQGFGATFPPTRTIDNYYSKGGTDAVYYGLDKAPDATYDKLHDDFLAATDAAAAKKLLQEMDKYVISQHWVIAAPESYNYTMWLPSLKGFSGESLMWGAGISFARLWISK